MTLLLKHWKTILIIILSACILSSCGIKYHVKKARKHILMARAKGAQVNADTIVINKKIVLPPLKFDTVFHHFKFNDTIRFDGATKQGKSTFTGKLNVTKNIDSTFTASLNVQVVPDTVIIPCPAVIESLEPTIITRPAKWFWWLIVFVAGLIAGFLLMRRR